MEGVAYRLGKVFMLLRPLLPDNVELVASGGALLHSPVWVQIIADVLGHPVTVLVVPEASARGVALLALEALGVIQDLEHAPLFTGKVYQPNLAHHQRYQEAMKRQEALYQTLLRV